MSTTSARRRIRRWHGRHHRGALDSTSAGCSGAIASTSWASNSVARRVVHPGSRHPVVCDEVDVVTRAGGQRGQQQCGIHRPVQPWPAARVASRRVDADPARRRASGVQHDHHAAVALRTPGPHHDVCAPRRGAPVDRAHVVADHVLAQRVELGALAADQHGDHAVQFAQLGQPGRQMLARQERRQNPHLPWHPMRGLPARQPERPTERAVTSADRRDRHGAPGATA